MRKRISRRQALAAVGPGAVLSACSRGGRDDNAGTTSTSASTSGGDYLGLLTVEVAGA